MGLEPTCLDALGTPEGCPRLPRSLLLNYGRPVFRLGVMSTGGPDPSGPAFQAVSAPGPGRFPCPGPSWPGDRPGRATGGFPACRSGAARVRPAGQRPPGRPGVQLVPGFPARAVGSGDEGLEGVQHLAAQGHGVSREASPVPSPAGQAGAPAPRARSRHVLGSSHKEREGGDERPPLRAPTEVHCPLGVDQEPPVLPDELRGEVSILGLGLPAPALRVEEDLSLRIGVERGVRSEVSSADLNQPGYAPVLRAVPGV